MQEFIDFVEQDLVSKLTKIIIYGAGDAGHVAVEYMQKHNIKVQKIIVTERKGNPIQISYVPVIPISEVNEMEKETPILIAAVKACKYDMAKAAEESGFSSVFIMSKSTLQQWRDFNAKCTYVTKEQQYTKRVLDPYLKNLSKLYSRWGIAEEEFIKETKQVLYNSNTGKKYITRLVIALSNKCSLRCKECNNLMPYFKPQKDLDTKKIIDALESILDKVENILRIELIGGEPFLAGNLQNVLERLVLEKKVTSIEITTNGTILPRGNILELLRTPKVTVRISDYGNLVNKGRLIQYLEREKISYEVLPLEHWTSPGGVEKRNRAKDLLRKQFAKCSAGLMCKTLYEDKLFACARASSLWALNFMKEEEFLPIDNTVTSDRLEEFFLRDYSLACDYCDIASENQVFVEPAEQC